MTRLTRRLYRVHTTDTVYFVSTTRSCNADARAALRQAASDAKDSVTVVEATPGEEIPSAWRHAIPFFSKPTDPESVEDWLKPKATEQPKVAEPAAPSDSARHENMRQAALGATTPDDAKALLAENARLYSALETIRGCARCPHCAEQARRALRGGEDDST